MPLRPSVLATVGLFLAAACAVEAPPPASPSPGSVLPPASSAPPALAPAGPPAAPVRPVSETLFGVTVTDPYRWMEQDSPERSVWMKAQNDFTRAALDALPFRAALLKRIHELGDGGEQVSRVASSGGRTFYLKRARGQDLARFCVRDTAGGAERILVDPAAEGAAAGHFSIDEHWPSPDGRLVAYKVSPNGSETGELRVVDAVSGKPLPDRIDRLGFSGVSWIDGHRFFYSRLRRLAPGAPQSDRFKRILTFVHPLGGDPERDPSVFGAGVSAAVPVGDDQFSLVIAARDGKHAIAIVAGGDLTAHTAPVARLSGPSTPWKKLVDPARDQVRWVADHGDDVFLRSHRDAPRFKVVKTSLSRPDVDHATVVGPESDLVISGIADAEDALYVDALDAGLGRLLRVPYQGGGVERIPLPVEGTLEALLAQDAVAHVVDGARYPAVLLTAGVNDPRVAAWMQMKLAARLQAATGSGKPVLLRLEYDGGHVQGATRRQEEEQLADAYAFLLWQLGSAP